MRTQPRCLSAVSSQSRHYQRATPTQLCVFFTCIDVVCSSFCLLLGWFTRNCAIAARHTCDIQNTVAGDVAGRIGEVVPPTSRRLPLHFPYSRQGAQR